MIRVFFAFLPLDFQRVGGVWWYRDFLNSQYQSSWEKARTFMTDLQPATTGLRYVKYEFPGDVPSLPFLAVVPPPEARNWL